MRLATIVLSVALSTSSLLAVADEDSKNPNERSPGDMTVEERAQMMRATNDYNNCVYKQAIDKVESDPDIRRIADSALSACQPQLDALKALIKGWKFPDYFATGFARSVHDRAVRNILPELATRKGS